MLLQHKDVLELYNGITLMQQQDEKFDEHFTYCLSLNKRNLQNHVDAIKDSLTDMSKDYNQRLKDLNILHAIKDKKGNPITDKDGNVTFSDPFRYDIAKKELNEEFKEVLDKVKEFLKTEEEVKIYKLKHKFPTGYGFLADMLFYIREEPKEEEVKNETGDMESNKKVTCNT